MQLKFQQSFVVSVDVPQIPFIDRVVDISTASQRQVRTVQIVAAVLGSVGTTPVVVQRQAVWYKFLPC